MVLDWLANVCSSDPSSCLSSLIVATAIIFASMFTLALTSVDKHLERRKRQAAEVKMLLDAHMNLWRGLRQMEAHAAAMHYGQLPHSHVLYMKDREWLRDLLRNKSPMLAPEIHDEYVEFLKRPPKPTMFDGTSVPAGSGGDRKDHEPFLADLSRMQQIAEDRWKKYEVEYRRLGGKYPHA